MIHCARSVPLDMRRVERCVCFWPIPAYKFIGSGHILFSMCMLQSTDLMLLVVLSVFQIFVISITSLFLLRYVFKNSNSIF